MFSEIYTAVGDWGTYYVIVKFDHFNYKSLRNNLGVQIGIASS